MNLFLKYLSLFGMAMLPVLELRGSVPWGVAQDLNYAMVLAVSILGNMVPVPFIMLFIRRIFDWMKKKSRRLAAIAEKLEARAQSKGDILVKYETLGLFILVAIPLPGTGAWTGALVASIFDLRMRNALPAIFIGVVTAGLIMTVLSYGVDVLI
ncbi:MAG: small multi-drug export protein [Clostridia bacterium]|nr:small multi-drug export protein [Clostridia bacterium]MBR3998280.1 small multi-drug export protein [Clostridia bacterium]